MIGWNEKDEVYGIKIHLFIPSDSPTESKVRFIEWEMVEVVGNEIRKNINSSDWIQSSSVMLRINPVDLTRCQLPAEFGQK